MTELVKCDKCGKIAKELPCKIAGYDLNNKEDCVFSNNYCKKCFNKIIKLILEPKP